MVLLVLALLLSVLVLLVAPSVLSALVLLLEALGPPTAALLRPTSGIWLGTFASEACSSLRSQDSPGFAPSVVPAPQ